MATSSPLPYSYHFPLTIASPKSADPHFSTALVQQIVTICKEAAEEKTDFCTFGMFSKEFTLLTVC
jgi:hypothetical protein